MQNRILFRISLLALTIFTIPIIPSRACYGELLTHNPSSYGSFTGKITRDKVRLRAEGHLDAPIVRETNRGDLFVVVGETPEFYAVLPPKDTKAFVFRTFVLDNVIEGSRVNVRLKPELEAPVIAQLNTGDRINGAVSTQNSKWFEITPPASARFYIAKEYIQKVGTPDLLDKLEKRKNDATNLLQTATAKSQAEMQKPFEEIHLEATIADLNRLIKDYSDLETQVEEAQKLLATVNEVYLQKKLIYLEEQAKRSSAMIAATAEKSKVPVQPPKDQPEVGNKVTEHLDSSSTGSVTAKMSSWINAENAQFSQWASQHTENYTMADFYNDQKEHALTLKGVIEPYQRPVKNKPGDYLLMNRFSNLPVAYLYSTTINLQDYVGSEVNVIVAPRPNNHFAYPAYYVLGVK